MQTGEKRNGPSAERSEERSVESSQPQKDGDEGSRHVDQERRNEEGSCVAVDDNLRKKSDKASEKEEGKAEEETKEVRNHAVRSNESANGERREAARIDFEGLAGLEKKLNQEATKEAEEEDQQANLSRPAKEKGLTEVKRTEQGKRALEGDLREEPQLLQNVQAEASMEQPVSGERVSTSKREGQDSAKREHNSSTSKERLTTEVKQERSADKAKLTVVDLREDGVPRKNIGGRTSSSRSQERQESGEIELTRLLQSKRTDQGLQNQNGGSQFQGRERNEASFSEIMVNLRGGGESLGSTGDTKAASMPDFQGRLLQQLREHLNGDIVKRGSIVVKDNGAGEIKLDLKPAELGQVRIRLSLENNNIAGRIFVENSSVKEAFDQNLQQLYRAFKEQGFDGASLNVTVGDHRRKQQQNGAGGFMLTQGNTASSGVGTTAAPRLSARVEDRLVDVMA